MTAMAEDLRTVFTFHDVNRGVRLENTAPHQNAVLSPWCTVPHFLAIYAILFPSNVLLHLPKVGRRTSYSGLSYIDTSDSGPITL